MYNKRLVPVLALILVLFSSLSGCAATGRINNFFSSGEFMQHSKIIDFGLFFVMFFALSYLGLTKVWGEGYGKGGSAKGAIVGLSLALALSLAFAIVSQTQFSITTIFPLAKAMFFVIIWFVLWGLLVKSDVFGQHWGGKIVAAIIALMAVYLAASMLTHMICQVSNNMDDPACKSDFFNAAYNLGGRIFGVNSWTQSGGGGYWPTSTGGGGVSATGDGGGIGGTPAGGQRPSAGEAMEGGCRLDITFTVASYKSLTSGAPISEFVSKAKAAGKSVRIYGFASVEGDGKFNSVLSYNRARRISKDISTVDSSISSSVRSLGETAVFGNDLEPNRRVVISTEPITHFMPAPAPGTLTGCEAAVVAGDKIEKEEKAAKDGESGSPSWWWLLLILPLLLLFLAMKRHKKLDVKATLTQKEALLSRLRKIEKEKDAALVDIRMNLAHAGTMDSKAVSTKANILIADIEKELKSNNWKDIKTLATEYAGDLDKIIPESKPFGINEQHMKLLVKILKKLREKYAGGDKFFAKKLDSLRFNAHLAEVTAAIVEGNKILNEIHRFFVLQMELKKHLKKFLKNEQKVLETVQETEYSTMFGKRFWGTKHIVKRKGWKGIPTPALADEVVRDIEKENNSSKHTLVEITEAVAKLCEILIAKIDEIVAEEDNVTHHVKDGLEKVTVRYEKEEKAIIADLIKAIEAQKKDMSEEWYPVIDHIDLEKGTVEGHIHYRRYK